MFVRITYTNRFSESGSLQPSVEEDDEIEADDFELQANNNNTKLDAELIAMSDSQNLAARLVATIRIIY